MDDVIQISKINDFLFCPHSIFLHGVYESFHESLYHDDPQKKGKLSHASIEEGVYSSQKRFLQGMSIYVTQLQLLGKIDIFDTQTGTLIERKYKLTSIFPGHRYQLYAQYLGMRERGYEVKHLLIHSLSDNKRYPIPLPDAESLLTFSNVIARMRAYQNDGGDNQSISEAKCASCIYRQLCHKSLC